MATNAREAVAEYLQGVGQKIGDSLELDDEGTCILETADGEECVISAPETGHLFMTASPLADLEENGPLALFVELMALNADVGRTGGATIALEADDKLLTLQQVHSCAGLDQEGFEELLERFMTVVDDLRTVTLQLRDTLGSGAAEDDGAEAAPAEASAGPGIKV